MTAAGRSPLSAVALGTGATVISVIPVFLTGALSVELREELAFGTVGLGLAVGLFRASTAATVAPFGVLADRIGAIWSLRAAAVTSAVALLGIAVAARSLAALVAWLAVGGCGAALVRVSANRLVVNTVPAERQGLAFGVKQSAPPVALVLAGLSVPTIALTFGWRASFGVAAIGGVAMVVALSRTPLRGRAAQRRGRKRARVRDPRTILVLAFALGLAHAAGSIVPAFYVDAAVRAGTSQSLAGTLLAVASAVAIAIRLGSGVACDRMSSRHLLLCAGLLAMGAGGFALLALDQPAAMTAGAMTALAGSWGFNAVFWFALMRAYRDMPGTVTGALAPGGLAGAMLGPFLFGVLVDWASYPLAWAATAAVGAAASAAMVVGARRLARSAPTAPAV